MKNTTNDEMENEDYIFGGYYMKARKIQESKIAHSAPATREIWDWLLMKANHTPRKSSGRLIQRGQLFCTYKDIINGLHWYRGYAKEYYTKSQCENAMKFLKKEGMITARKSTRGLVITIENYNYYQNADNYTKTTSNTVNATLPRQGSDTINKNDKNDKEKKRNSSEKSKQSVIQYTAEDMSMVDLLVSLIQKNNPAWQMKGNVDTWAENIEKIHRIDNRTYEQIEAMIRWTQQEPFWSQNILSTAKLREKFNDLIPRLKKIKTGRAGTKVHF